MELEQIEGTVEDIIYENPDNGYTVFEISGGGTVTVVCGIVGELHAGESVVCRGKYENHATYGRQFHAQECETDMPKDLEAVYAFLASGSLPYIGARTANKIIDKFGAAALEVIANDPAQLTLIPGISADKADRIQQEFKRMFGMRELIAYLAQFEISPRKAMEVFKAFGVGAMQAIASNPYLLCGEPLQLDFRHADSIAQNDHVTLEQVFVVVDKADHAAGVVHLQQTVDGAGLATGQLAEPFGGAAGGGAQGYSLGLIFQQLQNGVDRGGLASAGAAGEHKAVLCHSLADGFPLQGGVGKAPEYPGWGQSRSCGATGW